MIRKIGYACINYGLSSYSADGVKVKSKDRVFTNRTIRLKNFHLDIISEKILSNVKDLYKILDWNRLNHISFFRVSSDIFPYKDHPDFKYDLNELKDYKQIMYWLNKCGDLANSSGMRLSSHPGPYNCLGSSHELTVEKTILSLDMHKDIGNLLKQKDFVINIHVGGTYGGQFEETACRFCENFKKLSLETQKSLTVENDDKSSMWSVTKLYNYIHSRIGIPIILDTHHWEFCNEESLSEAANIALSTWSNMYPKIHYSESAVGKRPQAHSDFIAGPLPVFEGHSYDVMVEAKRKEQAILNFLG